MGCHNGLFSTNVFCQCTFLIVLFFFAFAFFQRYMPGIPKGLDPVASKLMKQRRKVAIRTFEAMSVLDISKGMMKEDDEM